MFVVLPVSSANWYLQSVAFHDIAKTTTTPLQDSTIPSDLVMSIIDETFVLQKQFGNIRSFNSRVAHRVTVVGDLHGTATSTLFWTISFQLHTAPHAPCTALYRVSTLIGCWLVLAI